MFIISSSFVSVSADNDSIIENNQVLQVEINSPPVIEYFWDNSTSVSHKYHLATVVDIEDMKKEIGIRDPKKNYNQIINGYGTGLAPPTLEEWNLMVGDLHIVDEVNLAKGVPLPTAQDLSLDPCFPKVGSQGQQGSCAAWATTYYTYGFLEAKDNGWTEASLGNQSQLLNPGWTYNKVNAGWDGGSNALNNGNILRDWGCPSWFTMPYYDDGQSHSDTNYPGVFDPYNDTDIVDWGDESAFREAPLHRANGPVYLPYDGATIISDLKSLLDSGLPITFRIDADEYSNGFADGNYTISSLEYNSPTCNHLNTIIGYDNGILDDGELGAFRVVNSWGDWWGDGGYFWLTYDALKEIGDLGQLATYYMTDKAEHQPSLTAVWKLSSNGTRNADIDLGVGNYGSPLDTKSPYFRHVAHDFPTFMCIDITKFEDEYLAGTNDFFLKIGSGTSSSTISDFWVEYYDWGTGVTLCSPKSLDTPEVTPGYVTVSGIFGKYPDVTINVYAINEIDDIDGVTGADWYYYTCLYDGDYTWTRKQGVWVDQSFVVVDREHDYRAMSTIVNPIIMLCEEDLTWDDYADVSSDANGGVDDVDHPITPPASGWYLGSYHGIYDIRDNTLSGDTVIVDSGYWLTSGNFDGSTGNDENDAEIWFDIWDNYELPVAEAGPNQNINTSITSNIVSFDGSSSTASDGSTIISYDWDFGEGNTSTEISPTHEYPIDGVYVVSLTVTDNMGELDIDSCIITVEGSKVHNYARGKTYYTIQYALDDAETNNWAGDTINVDPGTFNEAIDIRIPIDLIGSGIDATFINGGNSDTIDIWSEFVNISGFNISGNSNGIDVGRDDCNIFNNSISSQVGIEINAAANTTISNNSMFRCSIFLNSGDLEDYNNLVVLPSNTVNGRPVRYYKDAIGVPIPPDAGEVILINCTDMEISDQHFYNSTLGYEIVFSSDITVNNTNSSFNWIGGIVVKTFNSTVSNCTMCNNSAVGFYLVYFSHNNTIRSNALINNENGMIIFDSVDNRIFHNSFINNSIQAQDDTDANYWNFTYPIGGNYWSDYNGTDTMHGAGQDQTGADGIGDTPYNNTYGQGIQGGSAEDYYPLMSPGDFEDTIKPTSHVDFITPYWYNNSPLIISATASDTRSDILSVELWYSFEGGAYQLFGTDNLAPWEWNFNWSDGEGNYKIYSIAEDSNANIEPIPVTEDEDAGYDITAPTSEVNSITQYWQDDNLTITAIANDGISGVASVELYFRFSIDNITWENWTSFGLDSISPWSWNFDFPNDDGYYEFYTIANDNSGNIEVEPSTADAISAYDSGSPEIVDNSEASATTGEIFTVNATVEDSINVTSVHIVYWFGNDTSTNATASYISNNIYELAISVPSNSILDLHYTIAAIDHLGKWNSTTVKAVTITDNDAPTTNAGPDQTVVEDTIVIFDGSGSVDNIDIINYTWSFSITRTTIYLYGPDPQYNFTEPGNYSVTLTASDLAGNVDNDTLTITVQIDTDGDGVPDVTDLDDDNDGTADINDDFPTNPDEIVDTDNDGTGDNADTDDDGDGVPDEIDLFPLDKNESSDNDGDGIGDTADPDDDNDGIIDTEDTHPFEPKKPFGLWWIILMLIVVLAIMGAYIVLNRSNNNVETQETKPHPNQEILDKLEKAFNEGKISEEMYLMNLEKFKK